jgi:hypothetical protein
VSGFAGAVFKVPEKVVSYVAKSWCRVDYDDVVIFPLDKSELPDTVWVVDQPSVARIWLYLGE